MTSERIGESAIKKSVIYFAMNKAYAELLDK